MLTELNSRSPEEEALCKEEMRPVKTYLVRLQSCARDPHGPTDTMFPLTATDEVRYGRFGAR
jgi:hypothetical protein